MAWRSISSADLVAMTRATGRRSDALDLERLSEAHGELPGDSHDS